MIRLRFAGIPLVALALLCLPAAAHAQTKTPAAKSAAPKPAGLKPLDINSASEEEIVQIGIDRAVAKKIIQGRPFRNKSELVNKKFLTREQYDKLKDMVVAKRPPKPPTK